MKKNAIPIIALLCISPALPIFCTAKHHDENKWVALLTATNTYMHEYLWNSQTHNFVRRVDRPGAPGSDAWGITIELDARAYMIEDSISKPDELNNYFTSSSMLYEKTGGNSGARILARQGNQIYIGGDDDMQWCAALAHYYLVTKDTVYLSVATSAFKALIDLGFWQDGRPSKGWAWNSADPRPNGVSTAYGALAAARLYQATGDSSYKKWAYRSLEALKTPQVGFFPRDMMVAASAAMTVFEVSKDIAFKSRALQLEDSAVACAMELMKHEGSGERNPTDIGDLADGLYYFYHITLDEKYKSLAETFVNFFVGDRKIEDILKNGFYSRYDTKGAPILTGSYLGVPCSVAFLPEVAEMQKLFAIAVKADKKL
jgi:hypothetical protein